MKDLIILTDLPITYGSISSIIKNAFKSYTILNDTNELIYMKKDGKGFEIELSPTDKLSNPECMMDDTVEKCPNKDAFLTNLNYNSITLAKRIISLLEPLFGNMWIQSDEEDDWFGTSKEFIESYKVEK